MLKLVAAATAVTFLANCGTKPSANETPEQAIIRGTPVDPAKVRPVVIYTTGGSGCTGTFVSKDTFMTAAHCVSTRSVGSGKRYDGATVRFQDCILNPRYSSEQHGRPCDLPRHRRPA